MNLFVDTSVCYPSADGSGRNNSRAKKILSAGEALVTTDHVLVETWTLIHHRLGRRAAERLWQGLREGVAAVEPAGAGDLEAAWRLGASHRGQDFSIVDPTRFAAIRRLGISRAASFDDDFAVFRFGPQRRQALAIVR